MSYILEALRRADSERERGTVPTLHAHPLPAERASDGAGGGRPRPWLWLAAVILLLALGAGLARWLIRPDREPPVLPARMAQAPPGLPAAPPADTGIAAAARLPQPQQTQQAQQAPPQPQQQPEQRPATARPDPGVLVREPPRPPAAVIAPVARRPPPPIVPAPRAEAPVAERPVPLASALPEDIRRQLPALAAGGAMYSEAPANRMLIINGQLFHEGDRVAPDLVLEQIKLRGAVLSFKGQRFRISY